MAALRAAGNTLASGEPAARSGQDTVYFAGDTMLIPELAEVPQRLGRISLALLPVNGLRIRPAHSRPARPARPRTRVLKISPDWTWKDAFLTCWQRLSALPAPA